MEKNIVTRMNAINVVMEQLVKESYKKKAIDITITFYQLHHLWFDVKWSVEKIKAHVEDFLIDPFENADSRACLEAAAVVHLYLRPLERLMEKDADLTEIIRMMIEEETENALRSGSINIHWTSPIRNVIEVYRHQARCKFLESMRRAESRHRDSINSEAKQKEKKKR